MEHVAAFLEKNFLKFTLHNEAIIKDTTGISFIISSFFYQLPIQLLHHLLPLYSLLQVQ